MMYNARYERAQNNLIDLLQNKLNLSKNDAIELLDALEELTERHKDDLRDEIHQRGMCDPDY